MVIEGKGKDNNKNISNSYYLDNYKIVVQMAFIIVIEYFT